MNTAAAENLFNFLAMTELAPNLGSIAIPVASLKVASISCSAFVNEDAANTATLLCCAEAPHRKSATSAAASPIRLMRSPYRGSAMPNGLPPNGHPPASLLKIVAFNVRWMQQHFVGCFGDGNRKIDGAVKMSEDARCNLFRISSDSASPDVRMPTTMRPCHPLPLARA